MKQRQIKIYSFGRKYITDSVISSDNLEECKITLTESFLILAFECYKQEKLEDGQLIDEIIKVMLPDSEGNAKEEWDNGLIFNEKTYFAWFATTGGMKKEVWGKCETFFVREDFLDFAKEFEQLMSLGKFKEIEESKKEICINKDVLSRLSLGVSSCYMAGDMPDFIVLPQATYHIVKDYKTVEKFTFQEQDKKGNVSDKIDYNLVDYHFDKEIDVFDGGAIATPKVFEQIEKELGVKYSVEFAIIRAYGIGIKGMITKFDILRYLNYTYKSDTEYCKKIDGKFYLLDMWNQWQEVTDNTMLLNESMVKLAKYYDVNKNENLSTYKQKLASVDSKYIDIIGKLYVTKINKKDDEIEEYRRLNYQLLTALALSKKEYAKLATEDVKAYRKILKPFSKDSTNDEWKINIDIIRLFFENIIKNENEESAEFEEEAKYTLNNVVNKCEELLNISEDFINLKFVKNNLSRLIEKKCRDIACGKITAKAKYQYIAVDPISYMNYAIYRDQGENGLNTGEFYSGDCNDGDIRTIARNPLCAYSEVHNVKFIKNIFLDNYLSPCRELIYFNQKSDILALMSSGDTDGDACTVVDNEIIKNAVVIPQDGKYFINKDDGHKVTMECNFENRFLATYRASGNLIGSIALKSASVNSNSQQTYDYYDTVNKKFVLYSKIEVGEGEDKKAYVKAKLDSDEWLYTLKASEQHKEHIRQRFYDNEKDIYIVLYNAMVSIDAPKTLYFPSKADMEIINKKYARKAKFLMYKESKEDVQLDQYQYTYGLLDDISKYIKETLLDVISEITTKFDNKTELIQKKLLNADYDIETYNQCFEDIAEMYKAYTDERQVVNNNCKSGIRKENNDKSFMLENYSWSQWDEQILEETISKLKAEKYKQFKVIDAKYITTADDILKKYDIATIVNSIANMPNCTEDFIINMFFPVFKYLNSKIQADRYVYVKTEDGDINYLYEKYKKIPIEPIDNSNIVKNLHLEEKKRLKVIDVKADVRAKVLDGGVIELIQSELNVNGHIVFDIKAIENSVTLLKNDKEMLQMFSEFIQINEYSLLNCSSIKFEILVSVPASKKSLKLTATEIII